MELTALSPQSSQRTVRPAHTPLSTSGLPPLDHGSAARPMPLSTSSPAFTSPLCDAQLCNVCTAMGPSFALLLAVLLLSVASATGYQYPDCKSGPLSSLPIRDQNAPIQARANSLLAQLNSTEKISRISSSSNAVPRLGLPYLQWVNDALHGLTGGPNFRYESCACDWNSSTSFPSPINFAATFDDDLAEGLGHWTGVESRAFTNDNRGGVDLWSPNINPFRDPRWGRGQEVPGEDPYQGGRYAYSYVQGMQRGEDPRYYLAVADCKHYAAYDLDHWQGEDRTAFSANVSMQDLVEYFLPPFESCIRDALSGSVMCSYNALNGVPTCADDFLLQTVARELWGWDRLEDGWVTSDCDAVANIWDPHRYTKTPAEAAAVGLLAGTDLDCGGFYYDHLANALSQGLIQESDLDVSVLRLTKSLIRIGYFDDPATQPYRQYGIEHVNTAESNRVSYRAALESLTLLKNDDDTLPIDASAGLSVAVIGPLVTDMHFVQGNYRGKPPYVTTLLDALNAERGVNATYLQGVALDGNDTSGFAKAVALAKAADVTIFMGGITEAQESEGHDRDVLTWPGVQQQLIQQLAAASASPIVVLVMGGGQIDLSAEKSSDGVGALLWIGYPSMHGGRAIADVLFGRFSPSGRLVTTSYPASYVSLSMEDMQLRPNQQTGNPGRTYKWYTGQPVFPFGYGLSYTSFSYSFVSTAQPVESTQSWAAQAESWAAANGMKDRSAARFLPYSANVTNTGSTVSDTSVLLFASSSAPDSPIQQLIGYVHVHELRAGETRTVYFDVGLNSFLSVDKQGDRWLLPAEHRVFIGHAGHAEAEHSFSMQGAPQLVQPWPRRSSDASTRSRVAKE